MVYYWPLGVTTESLVDIEWAYWFWLTHPWCNCFYDSDWLHEPQDPRCNIQLQTSFHVHMSYTCLADFVCFISSSQMFFFCWETWILRIPESYRDQEERISRSSHNQSVLFFWKYSTNESTVIEKMKQLDIVVSPPAFLLNPYLTLTNVTFNPDPHKLWRFFF